MVELIRVSTRVGVDPARANATVDKDPTGMDMPTPCLLTTWPIKEVALVAAMVHFLQRGDMANVSTPPPIQLQRSNIIIGMLAILVGLMWGQPHINDLPHGMAQAHAQHYIHAQQ
jgi:hypothetical protein